MSSFPSKYAQPDENNPEPVGWCDRCGFKRHLRDLPFQFDWAGNELRNTGLRVCYDRCLDVPQPSGRRPVIIDGPEPKPIRDPRPGFVAAQMNAGLIVPED